MKYYIDHATGEIYAYESDGSQDSFISPALELLDDAGLAAARAAQAAANAPTPEVRARIERAWRDGELASSDGAVARQRDQVESGLPTTLTADQYKALQVYRQALRNWPESAAFPDSTQRPPVPAWLVSQAS